ncbi:MAG: hypothetical protein OIF51_05265 [Cellvibrionaceae bacterium]|nr:hypothetical protein [Cellvibrionaceae bacterium]
MGDSSASTASNFNKHWLWFVPMVLIILVVIIFAFRFAMADAVSYPARYASDLWFKEDRLPTTEELDKALEEAESARSWNPYHAEYHDLKAYLLWLAILKEQREPQSESQARINSLAQQAIDLHKTAIELRPRWPYSWSGIALMKAYQQKFDQEFEQAVLQAARFGPWENTVNIQLALVGQIVWLELQSRGQNPEGSDPSIEAKKLKATIIENYNRGIRRNAKVIARNLKQSPHRYSICAHLSREFKQYKTVCG